MSKLSDIFINDLIEKGQLQPRTTENYRSFINEYQPFRELYPDDIRKSVQKYLYWLSFTKKNADRTINNKISMLKRYNQFLATQNIITRDQLIQINHIKYRTLQRVPKFYSYDYLKKIYLIIVNSNNFTDDERLFIFLILNHAATFTEILSIEITNIDWEKRTIHIQTPTRERMLLLQKEDLLYLTRYILAKRNQIDVKQSFKLFQTNGKPYTRKNIIVALEKVSKYFEVRIGFTELRNTFIMYLIDIGMNPIYIKEYLGLKSFTSINRFKFVNHTFIKEVQQLINTMRSVPKFKTHNDNVIRNIFEEHYQENKLTHHLEYKEEEQ